MKMQKNAMKCKKKALVYATQCGLLVMASGAYAETVNANAGEATAAEVTDAAIEDSEITGEAPPSTTLDTITVYASSYRTTGTKTALSPEESPMSYTRIDQETLKTRQADSVNAALRYEPSVTSDSRGTVTIFDEYNIRGFKTYSNFYDGMRLPYDGTWNLTPQIDAYATEAVEVVKGPASSLYGYGAPGGMVNQVSKTPQSTQNTEMRLRVGSNDLRELALDSTGALTDNLNYRLVALTRKKDGQMQTTEEERTLVNPSLSYQVTPDLTVDAAIYYQNDPDMVPSTPLPSMGTVYRASYGELDSDAYAGDEWNHFEREVLMPSLNVNWNITDNLSFKHALRYTDADANQRNIYNAGLQAGSDRILRRDAYTTDETLKSISTDNQLAYQWDTQNTSHNLLFGIEYLDTDSTAKYRDALEAGTPTLDLSDPDYTLVDGSSLSLDNYEQNDDIKQKQLGIYVQDEMTWQDLTVVAGLRYDDYESQNQQTMASQGAVYDTNHIVNEETETSGRIAGIYQLDNGFAPYLSYAQSFEPVVGSNYITGEAFKATTADQIEAGVKYESADGRSDATLSVFDITQQNVVVAAADYTKQTQTGEIESKGFEVTGSTMLTDWMDVFASYSYTDAEITEDEYNPEVVGNTPVQTAKHKATLWADFYPTDKLTLNAGVRVQSGMKVDRQNSDDLPSVTLFDIGGEYRVNDWLSTGLSVSNLFDKRYVGSCYDANNCWMGDERQVSMSVTTNF